MRLALLPVAVVGLGHSSALAQDWPMYRGDAARSGHTRTVLPPDLKPHWVHRARHAPRPAWPRLPRMAFDRAFQMAVARGRVIFGSSADGKVRALDAGTGREVWSFSTAGPVRFAPCVSEGRVFVGSDDGKLYCLSLDDGRLLFARQGGPVERRVLGNGRMISRWPVRGGPVVADGVVYFAAGIWPTEGVYVRAIDARTGADVWCNEEAGSRWMGQPHGGEYAESGVSAQGHLVLTDDLLLVPTGRAVPAAFARRDGAFRYFWLQRQGHRGGAATMASGRYFFNSGAFFDAKTGSAQGRTDATAIAGSEGGVVTAAGTGVTVFEWREKDGKRSLAKAATVPVLGRDRCVLVAGGDAFVGGEGGVDRIDLAQRSRGWSAVVPGTVHGLATAGGRLYATTDRGEIHCFASGEPPSPAAREPLRPVRGYPTVSAAAKEILELTDARAGYCLDLGCGDGALAREIARRSELYVVAIDPDPEQVARARALLEHDGLYGARVTVLQGKLEDTRLPPYFADLVVSRRALQEGAAAVPAAEAQRLVKPGGGVVCIGERGRMNPRVRGPLPGAGAWTHQYADPANTVCSGDRVKGPLGMLWFREVDQTMTQRHGRGPAPLYLDGRVYSLGLDELVVVDAYNGRELWRHPFPGILSAFDGDHLMGTAGTQSCYCVSREGVFVRTKDRCVRLDPVTGHKLGEFRAPPGPGGESGVWGFIACENGLLYGSLADPEHVVTYRYLRGGDLSQQLTESKTLFAMDAKTGGLRWRFDAEHSIRHNAIALGSGHVFLIDRALALFDREKEKKGGDHPGGRLVALDAKDGSVVWQADADIWGTVLALSVPHGALLMSYQPTRFRLASEVGGRLAAFDAGTGRMLWEQPARYESRPLIIDRTVYAQGGAWDLLSGDAKPFPFSRSYGCGILAGGANLLVYRSATLGYFDLTRGEGNEDFGGIRPGCWINALPVGGLVIVPDGTAGCVCSYQNRAWIALHPTGLRPPRMEPAGGAFRATVAVSLAAEDSKASIRYTLDGSTPSGKSAIYRRPIRVARDATLKIRTYKDGEPPSRVVAQEFVIDPHLLPLDDAGWDVWDAPGKVSGAPSRWRVDRGTVIQSSNIFAGPAQKNEGSGAAYYGTLRIWKKGRGFANGDITLEIRTEDNDGIGLAFRMQDPEHHYLFHWDRERRFRVLARRDGDDYQVLAQDAVPYEAGRVYQLRVQLRRSRIAVLVDGQKVLEADDKRYRKGTFALHSWGSTGVSYRRITARSR